MPDRVERALRPCNALLLGVKYAFFFTLLLFLGSLSAKQGGEPPADITFRFVNPKSGKPASDMVVGITAWNVDIFHSKSDEVIAAVNTKTDKQGKIIFHLPRPIPKHMGISTDSYTVRGCSSNDVFSPEEILRMGAVATYNSTKCGPTKVIVKASPGEVVVLERPLSLLERMSHEAL